MNMKERRYSLSEIDKMRQNLFSIQYSSRPIFIYDATLHSGYGLSYSHSGLDDFKDMETRVENQLRTYMIGGLDPNEIQKKRDDLDADYKRRYEEEKAKIVERLLCREYGPR